MLHFKNQVFPVFHVMKLFSNLSSTVWRVGVVDVTLADLRGIFGTGNVLEKVNVQQVKNGL